MSSFLDILNVDMIREILGFLDLSSIALFSRVNKFANKIALDSKRKKTLQKYIDIYQPNQVKQIDSKTALISHYPVVEKHIFVFNPLVDQKRKNRIFFYKIDLDHLIKLNITKKEFLKLSNQPAANSQ
jgi:hypothetical protein